MLVTMRSSRQRDCCSGFVQLTERELAVLRLIAGGRTNAQIAAELYLSNQSVGRCIGTLLLRTHADNRAELVGPRVRRGRARPRRRGRRSSPARTTCR